MRLVEIKKKIQSTKNTRKITKALQLVAASKMKRFQRDALSARAYAWDLLSGLVSASIGAEPTRFTQARAKGKTLFVLVTSDKGLCGALNARLVRKLFASEEWKGIPADERLLLTVGRKATEAARREKIAPVASFEGVSEGMDALQALRIVDPILGLWESGQVKKVIMVSPHFVNAFTTFATQKTYLPLTPDMAATHLAWEEPEAAERAGGGPPGAGIPKDAILEPDRDRLVASLELQLVQMLFVQAFYELKASEYSSRMVAMKKASEAADDIVKNLTLEFNKARQAAITQSLAELSAAGAAIV